MLGSYLVATINAATGTFSSLTKIGTGFTDADLTSKTIRLRPFFLAGPNLPAELAAASPLSPDVWIKPTEVSFTLIFSFNCYYDAHVLWLDGDANTLFEGVHVGSSACVESAAHLIFRACIL